MRNSKIFLNAVLLNALVYAMQQQADYNKIMHCCWLSCCAK